MLSNNDNCLYAGIDLHKSYSYMTVMDKDGYIHHQGKHKHTDQTLVPTLKSFPQPVMASMESTYGWYAQADELTQANITFVLAHPTKINAIAGKKKTDKEDAKILADLHRTNLLPRSYIPTKAERDLRQIVRFRLQLVHARSQAKTRIRDLLQKQRLVCPYGDVMGKKGLEWLKQQDYPPVYGKQINSLIRQARQLSDEVKDYDGLIHAWAKHEPKTKLLQSVPGIGKLFSVMVLVEMGSIDRFRNGRAFASYCGVTPRVKSSGGKTYLGRTSQHGNPYLRLVLAEAVTHLIKTDPVIKQKYDQLVEHKGKGKARVAMMNRLARIIHSVLKRNTPYLKEELPPDD